VLLTVGEVFRIEKKKGKKRLEITRDNEGRKRGVGKILPLARGKKGVHEGGKHSHMGGRPRFERGITQRRGEKSASSCIEEAPLERQVTISFFGPVGEKLTMGEAALTWQEKKARKKRSFHGGDPFTILSALSGGGKPCVNFLLSEFSPLKPVVFFSLWRYGRVPRGSRQSSCPTR